MRIKLPGKRERKNKTLTGDQENFLVDVFELSNMTFTNPGRKDNVYIGKINGEKTFIQKRYLLEPQRYLKDTMKDLSRLFDLFYIYTSVLLMDVL